MKYIDLSLIDETDSDVKQWKEKALILTNKLCSLTTHEERAEFIKKHTFWSKFKTILDRYFGIKCWYTECDLTGNNGEIDHYRPKNRSTDENGKVILIDGYWYLTYNYLNFRLSCKISNDPYQDGGKHNKFPIQNPYPFPLAYIDDIPLLLDPCKKEDVQLIYCDEQGKIIALTSDKYQKHRVELSIKIYNLNESHLVSARRKLMSSCATAMRKFIKYFEEQSDRQEDAFEKIEDLTDDNRPFSSFARKYIKARVKDKPYEFIFREKLPWY